MAETQDPVSIKVETWKKKKEQAPFRRNTSTSPVLSPQSIHHFTPPKIHFVSTLQHLL